MIDATSGLLDCMTSCDPLDEKCNDMCDQDWDLDRVCGSENGDEIEDAVQNFIEKYVDLEAASDWLEETESSW